MDDVKKIQGLRQRLTNHRNSGISTVTQGIASKAELRTLLKLEESIDSLDYEAMQAQALVALDEITDLILETLRLVEGTLEEQEEVPEWIWKRLAFIIHKDLLDLTADMVRSLNTHLIESYKWLKDID